MKWITTLLLTLSILPLYLAIPPARAEAPLPTETPTSGQFEGKNDRLDAWLERLVQKESNGSSTVVIIDTNGKKSFGCLQFQQATFETFSRKFGIEGDILDCAVQKRIARAMLESDRDAWRNWYTSVALRGLGLPPLR